MASLFDNPRHHRLHSQEPRKRRTIPFDNDEDDLDEPTAEWYWIFNEPLV